MFKIKQKTRKIISVSIICSMLFMELFPLKVSAIKLDVGSAANFFGDPVWNSISTIKVVTDLWNKFSKKLNPDTVMEEYSKGPVNGAANQIAGVTHKEDAPSVDVAFTAEGAGVVGSHMTATAVTKFFKTDPKELYYTWYLKRQNCELTVVAGNKLDRTKSSYNTTKHDISKCDMDGDSEITENDWKIVASKIIVAGAFDANEVKADGSSLVTYTIDPLSSAAEKAAAEKTAGYLVQPPFSTCYMREPASGNDYELQDVTEKFTDCPSGTTFVCAASDSFATCDVLNPAYVEADYQANLADIAAANAWNIDPSHASDQHDVPSPYPIPNSVKSDTKKFCVLTDNIDKDCKIENYADLVNYKATVACTNGGTAMCANISGPTLTPNDGRPYTSAVFSKDTLCQSLTPFLNPPVTDPVTPPPIIPLVSLPAPAWLPWNDVAGFPGSGVPNRLFVNVFDKKCDEMAALSGDAASCTFEKTDKNACQHLFAESKVPGPGNKTGDGSFTLAEKKVFGADPKKASTNGIGKDEANAVGLGIDKFTWMLSPGDQVGVAVEGDSVYPTVHADGGYKRTWAFSKNTCTALTKLSEDEDTLIDSSIDNSSSSSSSKNKAGAYVEGPGGGVCDPNDRSKCTGILTAQIDLNQCLEENLLDPIADSPSKMSVQLNSAPENPINDPSGKGDVLTITSASSNTANQNALLYTWSVQKSGDGSAAPIDTTKWLDITTLMQGVESFSEADIVGLGKKELAIKLNMQDDKNNTPASIVRKGWDGPSNESYDANGIFYLKIKVKITGGAADGGQDAMGTVIVRVMQQQNEMRIYPVIANPDGSVKLDKAITGQPSMEICTSQSEKNSCYVEKNKIIGIEIPKDETKSSATPFEWFINGNPISCGNTVSADCANGNILFFPILGNVGESVDVVAKGIDSNREAVEVSRHFVIVEPGLRIIPGDTGDCGKTCLEINNLCPKYLGAYKDISGSAYPDCSATVWQTNEGTRSTVSLTASGQTSFDWTIDGQTMDAFKDQNTITIPIDKQAGESYNVGLTTSTNLTDANKAQMQKVRLALNRNWGIDPADSIVDENQSASMQIDVMPNVNPSVAISKSNFFGASLITHLPDQLMFLLKISLTSILMLFATGLLFAFIPETLFKEKE